ncbi:receptor-like protein 7 isoform X2 [Pistacia vera]|uniref:receptor-like protein 7 isoform X2 n=1 Tax=Pistacia vera TaxID=55513 RepID=UPI001263BBC7|nr:receptor-like protein 7 isoform X2 [Pistacia vera]
MGLSSCFFSFIRLLLWLSLFHLTLLAHFTSSMKPLCHDDERSSLLQFNASLIINEFASGNPSAYPKVVYWKADKDCCSWDGVTCSEVTGHLIELNLTSSYLYGSINSSSSLFHLVYLERLILRDNDFNGSKIPSAIKNLSRLSYLDLSGSSFSGQMTWEVLELSNLETLDLTSNFNLKLQKPGLRSLVEKLTHLKFLALDYVNISSPIPDILANLSSLTDLSLEMCQLQGKFPTKIFQLPNLRSISVRFNPDLSGSLPNFEKNSPLEDLRVEGTRFFGELPPAIGNLSSLEELDISSNRFSSQDSRSYSWMAKYSKLTFLSLSNTSLVGEFPSWLMSLTNLTNLYMAQNELYGTIPSQISNLTKLTLLALHGNQFQGPFPSALFDLENLEWIYLDSNNLNGTLDMDMLFNKLRNLQHLTLSSNNFSLITDVNGHTKVPKFRNLGLGSCNLIEFPNFLQDQDRLEYLDLSSNKLVGQIPRWFFNLSVDSLQNLDLSDNLLTGFD